MGNIPSSIPDAHVRIYKNIMEIQTPSVRVQMIQTILQSPEHIQSMKMAGVYGSLLHYVQQHSTHVGQQQKSHTTMVQRGSDSIQSSQKGSERAMNYFSACLRILQLEEEVAITPEALKVAYKKAVLRAHPDKGGSEKEFEAVTRAYAYLGEILERIHGGRPAEGKVEAPTALAGGRSKQEEKWKMVEPVRLNPSKLDLNTFNPNIDTDKY